MTNKSKTFKDWFFVVEQLDKANNVALTPETLNKWLLSLNCVHWAFALHDKDTTSSNTQKKPHFHVLIVGTEISNKANLLEVVSSSLNVDRYAVQVDKPCVDVVKSYRYLIHKDHIQKYQYDQQTIVSDSSWDNDYLSQNLFTTETLFSIESMRDAIELLGMEGYLKKRTLIQDWLRDRPHSLVVLDLQKQIKAQCEENDLLRAKINALLEYNQKLQIEIGKLSKAQQISFKEIPCNYAVSNDDTPINDLNCDLPF